ncbi:MAG: class I SAM-dependent methyltransferase [Solirubrobacterales bacterium]
MPGPPTTPDYDIVWREVYGDMQEHGPVHRHLRRLLEKLLGTMDYRSALDVGCGGGHNLELLADGTGLERSTGLDISEEALDRARRRGFTETSRLDIERDRLDDTWDLVLSSLVLEHLPDDTDALRNMRAMCGRHLLVSTIAGDFERYRAWDEQMGHVRNYRRGELEAKLSDAGFEVEAAIYWGFPFYSPLARLLQNRMTSQASHGAATRALAEAMYWLYFLNSNRRGDLLVIAARPV